MAETSLSEFEKLYLLHGIQDGLRIDGRNCEEYRQINVDFDPISNSYGSCLLKMGETKVIVTIKAEIGVPEPNKSNCGKIEFFVDCTTSATPEFQGRGGEDLAIEIVNTLYSLYSDENFDYRQLCIAPGKKCWLVNIDVALLESCGNLFDSTVLATKLALSTARLPKLVVKSDDEGDVSLEVPDDPNAILKLNIDNIPNSISVCKIGHNFIVDADLKEETVTKVKLIFGFDKNGCVRYTSKYGFGSLDPDTIYSMIDLAKSASKNLDLIFENYIKDEAMEHLTDGTESQFL